LRKGLFTLGASEIIQHYNDTGEASNDQQVPFSSGRLWNPIPSGDQSHAQGNTADCEQAAGAEYAVEEASEAGIKDIGFVTGRGKRAIEDHFDTSYELEHQIAGTGKGR